MKTVGLIGGIAPESTIAYYRAIVAGVRTAADAYPPMVINSIDLTRMLSLLPEPDALAAYMLEEIEKLARAGCDFGAMASNTPHIVFDRIAPSSPIPLISIVEVTADAVAAAGARRVALFGTGSTMRAGFYANAFAARGMEVVVPSAEDQAYIHEKYFAELVHGRFLDETRSRMTAIANAIPNIDGIILGGTELSFLLEGERYFDTTKIHVERIVRELLS